ncbi:MAG: DUF4139 domain-containing protein [Bryobacteraceae bacterium]|nr:DUF4139 domain-containing protein [Bryobacteraceae bacterium]MDW8380082.1 DUF4139 domain-containing protein [Bryobacterales bacterium]
MAAALCPQGFPAELPVRKVVLYKHGVGYFERAGELRAGESARLDFKASDMDDVLKSLTIEDRSGGKIIGLRYDASQPLEERLQDYPFQLQPAQALSEFLDQLKGARMEARVGSESLQGAIFSGRVVKLGDKAQEREQLTLLLDSGELRTFDLAALSGLKLSDPALQRQLKDYLTALSVARSKEKRSVYIDSSDARSRQIIASYMTPMAVWKSSYRLILKEGESVLEGWAIVDNTTGEDWNNVNLSLVSGRPVSFLSKLYEPRYRERPVAELPEEKNLAPVLHSGAISTPSSARKEQLAAAPASPLPRAPVRAMASSEMAPALAESRSDMASSVTAETMTREVGELFEYRFSAPVTVKKSESAMLPFLQQKIQARRLLIYSDRSLQNPMNAAEMINSSGKTLDGGPITVFESGVYAGEALVETFKSGDKRLISFGVDLGTRITTKIDSSRNLVREIKAARGVLTLRTALQESLVYTVRNIDAKPKTLIIEHEIRPEYKLLNQKPVETTAQSYRFEVKLAPSSEQQFPVNEERLYDQTIMVSNLNADQIAVYLQNQALSAEGRRQLESILAQKRQIAENERQIRELETEIKELSADQSRIKDSMTRLSTITGQEEQTQRYARQVAELETRLAGLRDRVSQLRRTNNTLINQMNAAVEKLAF